MKLLADTHFNRSPSLNRICFMTCVLLLGACATGTQRLELQGSFPVPLIAKSPVNLGIHLDDTLTTFSHKETVEKKGSWEVSLGPSQRELFANLATGVFQNYRFVDGLAADAPLDGVLKPSIAEVQFALPSQTRSDYYEVWIRYDFMLYDRAGTKVGQWKLPAYGKASKNNYGSKSNGLQAAAMAACRDAMAFFSINFAREPVVQQWIAAGKPLMPPPPAGSDGGTSPTAAPAATPAATPSTGADPQPAATPDPGNIQGSTQGSPT